MMRLDKKIALSTVTWVIVTPLVIFAQGTADLSTINTVDAVTQPPQQSTAAPYQFKNEGIFGCNVISGANSAGAMSAIGGVYVPVNDAAVTLNTGILTYKECVLRPLQDRLRESAMSALFKKAQTAIETGREGNKQYVQNINAELAAVDDKATYAYLTGPLVTTVRPEFKSTVQRALAIDYRAERSTNKSDCDFQGDITAVSSRPTKVPYNAANFEKLSNPSCIPYFAYLEQKDARDAYRANASQNQMTMWNWGLGFYAKTDNAANPLAEKVLTPASVIRESFQQIIGSPVRQLESANDIGQMIGALYAGVTTQIISDNKGLAGLAASVAGQPSYLDQVARESSQGVIGAAVNAALSILNAAKDVENRYLTAMNAVASKLTDTIKQLRTTESKCWDLVVPKVKAYAAKNNCTKDADDNETCSSIDLDARKIAISTSTLAFSQQVIDSQITPLANAAVINVQSSQKAFGLIDQLLAGVTNTSSLNTQRLALQQLDSLVAQKALHTSFDATNAAKQRDDVVAAMTNLVTDTAKAWGDSTDIAVGWCNINNQSVIAAWAARWKK